MSLKQLIVFTALTTCALPLVAVPVKVTMNAVSQTMTLRGENDDDDIPVGEPQNRVYNFDVAPGNYILTAYASDKSTVNGTIKITVAESNGSIFGDDLDDEYKDGIDDYNQFTIITNTAYVSNKHEDGSGWTLEDGDFTLDIIVNSREGKRMEITRGNSVTAGRYTFLALNGNSYTIAFIPNEEHVREGYTTLYRQGTLTANVNVTGAIPKAGEFSVKVPEEAGFRLAMKFTHFTDYTEVAPISINTADGNKVITYSLANGQVYNYRTWKDGGITHGGYFTMNIDESKRPELVFTNDDYAKYDPKHINHDVQSNRGFETGDIFLNINPQGYLSLNRDETFDLLAMRTWELTENQTNNYFIEPDFHYQVLDLDGNPSTDVIEIESSNTSPWSKIKAKGEGTAIVLVTYDGLCLNYYSGSTKNEYMGGEYWGAIWPENTGVFVVTVGNSKPVIDSHMFINENYNEGLLKLAGKYVDAEHDVFYYLDDTEGAFYSFNPAGAAKVEIAYPSIGENSLSYEGFREVSRNEDGSYTLILKQGRQIVKLSDESGAAVYQVLTAKPCHRELSNETRPGSRIFQPGDKVKIQYTGLFHPANKLAGIYNMSAYVTYNGIPNGSSLILSPNQYTFGSSLSAQAVTVDIPADYNVEENPVLIMNDGVIQVNGYGDPIGNHRNTDQIAGRSPNFTAVPHKTYFGMIPDLNLPLTSVRNFRLIFEGMPQEAVVELNQYGQPLEMDEDGIFNITYGEYALTVKADGYRCYRGVFNVEDDQDGDYFYSITLEPCYGGWDGIAAVEPVLNADSYYEITSPAELAWFANHINEKGENKNALLLNDIDLADYDFSPIGKSSSISFSGMFNGQGHVIKGLYINNPSSDYQGLFGYAKDAVIENVIVDGLVAGKQYVAGVVAYITGNSTVSKCANYAEVDGVVTSGSSVAGKNIGGIVGYFASSTGTLSDCYNVGNISGNVQCGGIAGANNKSAIITNIFNIGEINGNTVGGCVGGTADKSNISNAFTTKEYDIIDNQLLVSMEQMHSGEIAFKLGEAFGQTIGVDSYPVFDGMKVYYDEEKDEYYNLMVRELIIGCEEYEINMNDSTTIEITASYLPANLDTPEVIWTSSDETIASIVDGSGLNATIMANSEGVAEIRIELVQNPNVYDTCQLVVVGDTVGIKDVAIDGNEKFDVYDLSGKLIMLNASAHDMLSLEKGMYIIRHNKTEKKIMLK